MNIKILFHRIAKEESGFALTSTTIFIFFVVSIFAIYLTRFTFTSNRSSVYMTQNIKARNLAQTALDVGIQKVFDGDYQELAQGISGALNKGTYSASVNELADESNNTLLSHHSMVVGEGSIGEVNKKSRLIISSYPNAFNLAIFGNNVTGSTPFTNTSSTIDGDVYFAGNTGGVSVATGHYVYNNTGTNGIKSYDENLTFPQVNLTHFQSLLASAPQVVSNPTSNTSTTITYDFEDGDQGWSKHVVSYRQTWGRRTTMGNGSSFGTGYAMGTINNGSTYGTEHSYVMSPIFDATGGGVISFNYWANNEYSYYDREHMEISYNEGSSWVMIFNYNHSMWSNSWSKRSASYTIPSSSGTSNTRIRVRYNTIDGCCGYNLSFFIDNVTVPASAPEVVDHGNLNGITINLGINQTIGEGPTVVNGVLSYTNKITLTNCNIIGPGKIVNKESIHLINSTVGGGIEIATEDSLIIKGSSSLVGSNVSSLNNSVVAYSEDYFGQDAGQFNGIVISNSPKTEIKNSAQFNGALLSLASNVDVTNYSQVNGSIVSNYGVNISGSTVTKGNLVPVFANDYGIKSQVIPGSYKEF